MKQFLEYKRINNTWEIILIGELPDNLPVLVVNQMPNKSLAEFHLAEYCLVPKGYLKNIETELAVDEYGNIENNEIENRESKEEAGMKGDAKS